MRAVTQRRSATNIESFNTHFVNEFYSIRSQLRALKVQPVDRHFDVAEPSSNCQQNPYAIKLKLSKTNQLNSTTGTSNQPKEIKESYSKRCYIILLVLYTCVITLSLSKLCSCSNNQTILSDGNFTFAQNGSFMQIDAGRDWPFNSKREISFRFKTKSPHGLLLYQTFDHSKLSREDDVDTQETPAISANSHTVSQLKSLTGYNKIKSLSNSVINVMDQHVRLARSEREEFTNIIHSVRTSSYTHDPEANSQVRFPTNTITAAASKKLANSLLSTSPASAINGNSPLRSKISLSVSRGSGGLFSGKANTADLVKEHSDSLIYTSVTAKNPVEKVQFERTQSDAISTQTIVSSSTISSFSASLYELYLKLENGRLKIMYEFGSRLNQTYCGKGLNDDRWHRIDLKVDPDLNQMILILDQVITVEIMLNQQLTEDENLRRNDLVFTNSILYLGGLDSSTPLVKNVKQRLYMAQFIGCIGQIMLKTDQHPESNLQPASIDKITLVSKGCLNRCKIQDYCLHKTPCVNHYTHTKCDCFGTQYEDVYCWRDKLTTLSMLGYSTLIYRIFDWRDRHHSSVNRISIQFKTFATDSILFFAYGDLVSQLNVKSSSIHVPGVIQTQTSFNLQSNNTVAQPNFYHQTTTNNNYVAISLSNGSLVMEMNFGDQVLIPSNTLNERFSSLQDKKLYLADGNWHNVSVIHNTRQVLLIVDDYSTTHTIHGKNYHLYLDPSIYVGGVPNHLYNETRLLSKPFSLRHKFVGCLRSVYFNQHDILLALKENSRMVEYRDAIGKPSLNTCMVPDPKSLPLTIRSGRSYLMFQLASNTQQIATSRFDNSTEQTDNLKKNQQLIDKTAIVRKPTTVAFEYKTSLESHFLAGGYLRDLTYHDTGGFWTLQTRPTCNLRFTIDYGIATEPEQVIEITSTDFDCDRSSWFRVVITTNPGLKVLNITYQKVDETNTKTDNEGTNSSNHVYSFNLKSSIELLHQVQIAGDLAKFGESSSVPFSGCLRKIYVNGRSYDSREFITTNTQKLVTNVANSSLQIRQQEFLPGQVSQGFLTLDSCQLANPCSTLKPCKNNGICKINELGDPECDCSKTGYAGKRCQFSLYKQSCQDLYLSGQHHSSYYLIDIDRNGPLRPIRVRCNMDEANEYVETVLSHNLPPDYLIRRSASKDVSLDIVYLAFYHAITQDGFYNHDEDGPSFKNEQDAMLRHLIGQSLSCKQVFRYDCRSAPLHLGERTWLESTYPKTHRIYGINNASFGKCMCATSNKKCLDTQYNCNCDSGESTWSEDTFEFTSLNDIGITKIILLEQEERDEIASKSPLYSEPQARLTLSDLRCYGNKHYADNHEITFKTSDAYIEVPGWRRGDVSFSFRTASNPPAIILFQLATSRNHGYIRLTLVGDTRLMFEYIVNRKPRKTFISSTRKLNNGEWQQVFIEYDLINVRLSVNDNSLLIDLDETDYVGSFEGPLFIGGAPSKYLIGDSQKRNGFTGCFRGLTIDGNAIDLGSYLSASMPTVISGCRPSCSNNLCQNGGKCIEYWGSYECECSNPIAHSGNNCEINLNTNSITFVTQEAHFVQVSNNSLLYPVFLMKNILLNIRTYQETALILYASDHLNNFLQLHKNGPNLVLTFNTNNTIIVAQVPIEDQDSKTVDLFGRPPKTINLAINSTSSSPNLTAQTFGVQPNDLRGSNSSVSSKLMMSNKTSFFEQSIKSSNTSGSGQPVQVKIERNRIRTTFYVNNNYAVVEKPMIFMLNYTQNPWVNPEFESVRPPRPKIGSKTYSQLFLANVDEFFNTRLPGFTGCIQGFSIDNQLFDFNRAHLKGEFKGEYKIGCKMHCDSFPCRNQGTCIENWKEDRIECKCDSTSYVGQLCDEDIAAIFNGRSSYLSYDLRQPVQTRAEAKYGGHEGELIGRIESSPETSHSQLTQAERRPDWPLLVSYFEVSLAFSTDSTHNLMSNDMQVQVILLIRYAKSTKHFLLGLTYDGSLLIQEDYGASMSLSRLIKGSDQPLNDGHRHMVKYTRYNQTIQIVVDYQTYLPSMGVLTSDSVFRVADHSSMMIGGFLTSLEDSDQKDVIFKTNYTYYSGCISNMEIKIDDIAVKPLSEAFGHNIEPTNSTNLKKSGQLETIQSDYELPKVSITNLQLPEDAMVFREKLTLNPAVENTGSSNKASEKETLEGGFGDLVVRDVEQGKCANFKRSESINDKKLMSRPKVTPLLEPQPVFMDPPRMKSHKRALVDPNYTMRPFGSSTVFYCALTILVVVVSSTLIYTYVLQLRYKSEKFRSQTPFFHKRDVAERGSESRNEI